MANGVKFIRVHGRIVPIRSDQGVDLRSKQRPKVSMSDIRAAQKEAQSKTRLSPKAKFKNATLSAIPGGIFGSFAGSVLGAAGGMAVHGVSAAISLATKGKVKIPVGKAVRTLSSFGAATGAVGGALVFAASANQGLASNRQYNKALGKRLAKKGTTG